MDGDVIQQTGADLRAAATIRDVLVDFVNLPLKRAYNMGRITNSEKRGYRGLVVRVLTEGGVVGVGEVFVTVNWYGADTPASNIYLIEKVFKPLLVGRSVFELARNFDAIDRGWMGNYWAKTPVELALHDAAAKTLGIPLIDLIGGKVRDRHPLVGGIGSETPEEMAAQARAYVDRGFKTIKLKIAEPANPQLDIDRVRLVREEVGPGIVLRADANSVYDVPTAIKVFRAIERYELDHVEQPVPDWNLAGMVQIRNAIGIPLMADEAVHTPRDAIRVIAAGAADVIKIKIAKCGGYRKAAEIVAICANHGVEVVVGNGVGTSAASLHELCFVASRPEIHSAGEFPGPDKLKGDIMQQPMRIEDGYAYLPEGPGIGALDEAAFAARRVDLQSLPM